MREKRELVLRFKNIQIEGIGNGEMTQETDGQAKSWALKKGFGEKKKMKRLRIHGKKASVEEGV